MIMQLLRDLFALSASDEPSVSDEPPVYLYWNRLPDASIGMHKDPQISDLLQQRWQKGMIAHDFYKYVEHRLKQEDLTNKELIELRREAGRLSKICVPDDQPYNPLGKKVFAATSFNGSTQVSMAIEQINEASAKLENNTLPSHSITLGVPLT